MKVVAFIADSDSAEAVASWARALSGHAVDLEILFLAGWRESASPDAIRATLGGVEARVTALRQAEVVEAVVRHCRKVEAQLLITSAFAIADWPGQDSDRLLDAAPCRAIVGHFGDQPGQRAHRALVVASGGAHDLELVDLVRRSGLEVTVVAIEEDVGDQSESIGRRFLTETLRDANLEDVDRIRTEVIVDNQTLRGVLRAAEGHDLVLLGMNQRDLLIPLRHALEGAAVAVLKRTPPLSRRALSDWIPRINPADYVELVNNLRAGMVMVRSHLCTRSGTRNPANGEPAGSPDWVTTYPPRRRWRPRSWAAASGLPSRSGGPIAAVRQMAAFGFGG